MRQRKFLLCVLMVILSCILVFPAYSHSGRTDSNGGHKDNKNASGLGSYHYHCGGYPAHLHTNGVCPYTSSGTGPTIKTQSVAPIVTPVPTQKPKEYIVLSDAKGSVDGEYLPLFVYNDTLLVMADSLDCYGFDITFDTEKRILSVCRNAGKELQEAGNEAVRESYGAIETNIKIALGHDDSRTVVTGYNGDGNMFFNVSELEIFGVIEWNDKTRELVFKPE